MSDPPPAPRPSGSTVVEPSGPVEALPLPVRPVDGTLTIDIYRDFRYVASGWPMVRSTSQSPLSPLTDRPSTRLRLPDELSSSGATVLYGSVPLGNSPDPFTDFALAERQGTWSLYIDKNNNEDLRDDGAPDFNEGSGVILAADVAVEVEIVTPAGDRLTRPYDLWLWFNESSASAVRGRFYSRNHYAGAIEVAGQRYDATVFEFRNHDALYRESGVCIDLDADGKCQEEQELFRDGDSFTVGGSPITIRLAYP